MNRYTDNPSFGSDGSLKKPIPRIAAVHDISCLGRCALTVIIPVISAMGLQAVPLPTALLSTHTGGFENMFFADLTHHMGKIASHWKSIGTDFDAIYSGFLGSAEQIDTLVGFIKDFSVKNDGKRSFIFVDPVMGDDGELYSTYDKALMLGMNRLCYGADLITPNLTEACFLTDEKYPDNPPSDSEGRDMAGYLAKKLIEKFGCKRTVVTGVVTESGNGRSVLTVACEKNENEVFTHSTPLMPRAYPGTGDVFASVLLGKILSGGKFGESVGEASSFVAKVTELSQHYETPIRDGLVIEPYLHELSPKAPD
jgi:pyridoxine kinase